MRKLNKVLIVGAGPSGLLLAILLSKHGIPTLLVDKAPQLDSAPRASHYSYPATYELQRAGVLDAVLDRGFRVENTLCWRTLDGQLLAEVDTSKLEEEKRMVCLPLNRLTEVLLEHLSKVPCAEIRWSHNVTSIGEEGSKAWIKADTPDGEQRLEADYVVGCDGAKSQIRRSLFGDSTFPGKTWDEQIVATNTYYDMSVSGWNCDSAFIIDKDYWGMIARIQPDGLLRITYGEKPGLTREEYLARQPMMFKKLLPGNPDPDQYKVVSISPYKVHQRLAPSMRVGRFVLAADAAHLCNPFNSGGLGLTGGIADVGSLSDCLAGIHKGLANDSILDRYSIVRREKYQEIIDPVSSTNLLRMSRPEEVPNDPMFKALKETKSDPIALRKIVDGLNSIMHDFTKEYNPTLVDGTTALIAS
ncbi:FAD/NAD(P)-binding domain-containing protein, partial [Aureobasidium melanogenum]